MSMSSELLERYRIDLLYLLDELKNEEERDEVAINKVQSLINDIDKSSNFDSLKDDIDTLTRINVKKDVKNKIINDLKDVVIFADEAKNDETILEDLKIIANNRVKSCDKEDLVNEYKSFIDEIKEDYEYHLISEIESLNIIDNDEIIVEDLSDINEEETKEDVDTDYVDSIDEELVDPEDSIDSYFDDVDIDDNEEDEEDIIDSDDQDVIVTRDNTKDEVFNYDNEEKKSRGKGLLIAAGIVGVAALSYFIGKSCTNQNTNRSNIDDNNTSKVAEDSSKIYDGASVPEEKGESSSIPEAISRIERLQKELLNKGYSEYAVFNMMNNFNDNTLNRLVEMPYIKEVENYAFEKDFNLDYIRDYENARVSYELTSDKAVDYVNRAYKIDAAGFYLEQDKTINEIVAVIRSIDNKDLYKDENGMLNQSLHTTFNRIMDNYLFDETEAEDIAKLDALKYFAKEGTDMDKFLTKYSDLAQNILKDQNNKANNEALANYLYIYSTSLNGFTNIDEEEPTKVEDITKSYGEDFVKSAQVNDYHDWYILEQSFIGPMFNLAYHKDALDLDLFTIEGNYYSYDNKASREAGLKELGLDKDLEKEILYIYDIIKIRDLQTTAELSPEITALCGKEGYVRVLQDENNGGEE